MFRGFNLDLNWNEKHDNDFFSAGQKLFASYEKDVKDTLKNYTLNSGVLNGSQMQNNWFPQIDADIFISHSHKDEKRTIAFAGWLYETFGIKTFIDSCIWGYSNDLLKLIDDKYCYQKSNNTYNYKSRNYSTSHVHMMLSVALTMMIDNTECIFFLNTPNSISASSIIDKTESPWIYSEIAMTQMIRKRIPKRTTIRDTKYFTKAEVLNESLIFQYEVDLSHLTEIDDDTLNEWTKGFTKSTANKALDRLYAIKPIKDKNNDLIFG